MEKQINQSAEDFSDLIPNAKKKKRTKSDKVATILAILIVIALLIYAAGGVMRLFTSPGLRDVQVTSSIWGNRHIVISHSRLSSYFINATLVPKGGSISLSEHESRPHDGFMGQYVIRLSFVNISYNHGILSTFSQGVNIMENTPSRMDDVYTLITQTVHSGISIYIGSDTEMEVISAPERLRFLRGHTRVRIG